VYFFSHVQNVNGQPSPAGATHTAELSFMFNNPKGQANQTWTDGDVKLADQMSTYWANFIMTGNPNGNGLPQWPEYKSLTSSKVMVFGDAPQAEPANPSAKLQFYTAAYQRMLRSGTN
jgi:para-nitrobenzyl esterase